MVIRAIPKSGSHRTLPDYDSRQQFVYGYPTERELWRFESWMTQADEMYTLGEEPVEISIDWKGQLPYPEGDRGTSGRTSNLQ